MKYLQMPKEVAIDYFAPGPTKQPGPQLLQWARAKFFPMLLEKIKDDLKDVVKKPLGPKGQLVGRNNYSRMKWLCSKLPTCCKR